MAHLFTYASFPSGVLGLAYIGSPRPFSVGGICSPRKISCGHFECVFICMKDFLTYIVMKAIMFLSLMCALFSVILSSFIY